MICKNCQTTLPDQAVACWKCGKPVAESAAPTVPPPPAPETPAPVKPKRKPPIDPLVAVFTMILSTVFFACIGWSVPFLVWGKATEFFKDNPQLGNILGTTGGVISAFALFVGVWWFSAWIITRLIRSS